MYNFRLATQNDYDFLYKLNKATMKDMVIKTFGSWDEEYQKEIFKNYFKTLTYEIILVEGQDVGCLSITKNDLDITVNEIQILPEFQCMGIGTSLFTLIINDSEKLKIPIKLKVLKVNEIAKNFYTKMGFIKYHETNTHYYMIRTPIKIN